jgi:HD-like signal output (HDOD) protein
MKIETALPQTDEDAIAPAGTTGAAAHGSGALEFLLRRMSRKPDFPAISQNISRISQKAQAGETAHSSELANEILRDYGLTGKLLKLVNSPLFAQYGGGISTVSRAVIILGFEQVRTAALGILLFEHLNNASQAADLKTATCSSFISGVIARQISAHVKSVDSEQAFIAAMFYRLGKHLTIYYFPEEYAEVCRLVSAGQTDEATAVRRVLGASYAELGTAVAKQWQLPESITVSMRPLPSGPLSRPTSQESAFAQVIAFSNEIAEIATQASNDKIKSRLSELSERYKRCFALTPTDISSLATAAQKDLKEYAQVFNVNLAKTGMLKSLDRLTEHEHGDKDAGAAEGNQITAQQSSSTPERQLLLLNGISEITRVLVGNYVLNDLLVMVLETLYRSLGYTRTLFCIKDTKRELFAARFGFGEDIDTVIPDFRFTVSEAGDFFREAVVKMQEQFVPDVHSASAQLPGWCQRLTAPRSVFLYPVVVNNVCIGLIYADRDVPDAQMTPELLGMVRVLCGHAALAIQQRNSRK